MCDLEMTPSKSSQETDTFEDLILTPSLPGAQSMSADLVLEAGKLPLKAKKKQSAGLQKSCQLMTKLWIRLHVI